MLQLDVTLPHHTYPVIFGKDILQKVGALLLKKCPGGKATIVSDAAVWELHRHDLEDNLRTLGIETQPIIIPPGEKSKSLDMLGRIYNELYRFDQKRSDPVIAFGGGVVGDLAGFAASTYMRGVPLIQIPTTLLAQADSSVGGKVAVNLAQGKNLVGSFYQPSLVIADTALLSTLPQREWNAGMAEVIKYAALGEPELLSLLRDPGNITLRLDEIIYLCCKCKAGYVERDERDTQERMMLNFGHTFGHAIERYHQFQTYNHGEAVAIGMALALRSGALLGVSEPGTEEKMLELMDAYGLRYQLEDDISEILPLMPGDKKNNDAAISLVLLKSIGAPFIHKISLNGLRKLFKEDAVSE